MRIRNTVESIERHLLEEYKSEAVDIRDPELIALENTLHEGESEDRNGYPMGLHGWASDHERKYPNFTTLNLDHFKYKWQRIDENKIPASPLVYVLPRFYLVPKMRKQFVATIGQRAESALIEYDTTPADETRPIDQGGLSVSQKIGEILMSKQSILVAVGHAESLDDIAVNQGPVAIAAASKRSRFIRRVGSSLSKTLTREKYKGKPVPHHFKFFGTIHLTIPNTDNADKYGIPDKAKEKVVFSGIRSMFEEIDNGSAVVMAPTGTGMGVLPEPVINPETGEEEISYGPQTLEMPGFSETTMHVISKFGYFVVAASWGDKVSVSSVYELPDWEDLAKERGKKVPKPERLKMITDSINIMRLELAQRTADTSEIPVRFESAAHVGEHAVKRIVFPRMQDRQ